MTTFRASVGLLVAAAFAATCGLWMGQKQRDKGSLEDGSGARGTEFVLEHASPDSPMMLMPESTRIEVRESSATIEWENVGEERGFNANGNYVSVSGNIDRGDSATSVLLEVTPRRCFEIMTSFLEAAVLSEKEYEGLDPFDQEKYCLTMLRKQIDLKNFVRVLRLEGLTEVEGYVLTKTASEGVAHLWFSDFDCFVGGLEFVRKDQNEGTEWLDELVSLSMRAAQWDGTHGQP